MSADKYSLLRRILKAIGLSEERIEELIGWIQSWLQDDREEKEGKIRFPYRLRDDFMTPAEQSFYHTLRQAVGDWALIAPKVSLGDLFFAQTGDYSENRRFTNKIDRKHVDFLLYSPDSLKPLVGIELDDRSHQRSDRQARDRFVDGVFGAAGLPIVHVPVRQSYQADQVRDLLRQRLGPTSDAISAESVAQSMVGASESIPTCPDCGAPMILRTARKGPNQGGQFWGCSDYPTCRGIRPMTAAS